MIAPSRSKLIMESCYSYHVLVTTRGEIEKIIDGYIVVKWDDIAGHWHYTEEQAQRLVVIQ